MTTPDPGESTNTLDRREFLKQETRQRIVKAAVDLLLAEGVGGFSMRKVAAKAGYTATAIYFHFPDKESLLGEVCAREFGAFRNSFERVGRVADPIERLVKMGKVFVDFAMEVPDHYRLMFLSQNFNLVKKEAFVERGNPAQDCYAYLKATVTDGLAAGRFRPEFKDADELSQIFFAAVHGLSALHIVKGEDPWVDWRPIRPTARKMIEALIRGLTRDAEDYSGRSV
jgi:AcrR family transcriptional regulator